MVKEDSFVDLKIQRDDLVNCRRINKKGLKKLMDANNSSRAAKELSYLDPAIRFLYFIHLMQMDGAEKE